MRWPRPKSLNSLMLVGLALIALPLLFAIVNAALQIRALADRGQKLVEDGVAAARASQDLFAQIASMERTAQLYDILRDPNLMDAYQRGNQQLSATRSVLYRQQVPQARASLDQMGEQQALILRQLKAGSSSPSNDPTLLNRRFAQLSGLADRVAQLSNAHIDTEVEALEAQTQRANRRLWWQSALLLPVTLIAILGLTLAVGRPLRKLDRAISELGRGAFSRPIRVSGPVDLEQLAGQLEWLRGRLLDLANERNRFLRHMSHELKTPLANIREGTELLMDGAVGELDSNQREVTAILRENGIKLQRLIENLLSFSAWQTNSTGLETSEFRLRPVVKQVLENQQLTLLSQRVRLDVKIEDVVLVADRGKLRLILENLLSNAIKYSPKGGAIHIDARRNGEKLTVEVADSGPGIPLEERAHIFEAFYTSRSPKSGSVKGTGIGLSVVLEFVSAHGGKVEILDGKFPGAHFRITMPIRPTQDGQPDSTATGTKEPARAA